MFTLFTVGDITSYIAAVSFAKSMEKYGFTSASRNPLAYLFSNDRTFEDAARADREAFGVYAGHNLESLNYDVIFESLAKTLWRSRLPCFDVHNETALEDNDSAFVKACHWKSLPVPCDAIFDAVPTDVGMCCSFNMAPADSLFVDGVYSRTVVGLQREDKNGSFGDSRLPDWFTENNEPTSKAGQTMGLRVTLDGNADKLVGMSVENDYASFSAVVTSPDNFPLMNQRGFKLERGHHNMIAVTSTIVSADPALQAVDPGPRGCLFPDEKKLVLYRQYSQVNCFFECTMRFARRNSKTFDGRTGCTPWYYPFVDGEQFTCDPFTALNVTTNMAANVPDDECSDCLPDCNYFLYAHSLSVEPFRGCDDYNLGLAPLCDLERKNGPFKPVVWGEEVGRWTKENPFQTFHPILIRYR